MSDSINRNVSRDTAVLAAVCVAAVILPLSFSAGAISTPAIGRALGGGPVALNWIANAFMLAFGSCLMAAGTLADRFGRPPRVPLRSQRVAGLPADAAQAALRRRRFIC